jgi:hypothetical protein
MGVAMGSEHHCWKQLSKVWLRHFDQGSKPRKSPVEQHSSILCIRLWVLAIALKLEERFYL